MPCSVAAPSDVASGDAIAIANMSDGALLGRFIDQRDEAAFGELVARHGPLVRGVCKRMLGDSDRAADAAQATFFILAYRCRTVRNRLGENDSLAPWLHRVAKNSALQLRRSDLARSRRENMAAQIRPASAAIDLCDDTMPVIDEEIQSLPPRHRDPLILCYIEGRTLQDVSERLGVAYGTLRHRLEEAKTALRGKLARRGIIVSVMLLGDWLRSLEAEAAPPNYVNFQGVSQFLDGWPQSPDLKSQTSWQLAQDLLRRSLQRSVLLVSAGGVFVSFMLGFFVAAILVESEPNPIQASAKQERVAPVVVAHDEDRASPPVIIPRAIPEAEDVVAEAKPEPKPKIGRDFLPEAMNLADRSIQDARVREAGGFPAAPFDNTNSFFGEMNINGKVTKFSNLADFQRAQAQVGGAFPPVARFPGGFPPFGGGGGMLGNAPVGEPKVPPEIPEPNHKKVRSRNAHDTAEERKSCCCKSLAGSSSIKAASCQCNPCPTFR